MARALILCALALLFAEAPAQAVEIRTNVASFSNVPTEVARWLTPRRIDKITDRVERMLEWDIRRVRVTWYASATEFAQAHRLGAPTATEGALSILAVARRSDQSIHIGPKVTESNFDATFAHELTHIVLYQKYKAAIPTWLDEGLANYVGRKPGETLDYAFLAAQNRQDIQTLTHPFASGANTRLHYQLSTAAIEMIAKRCSLSDLLQLSVGSQLETYLKNTCELKDLNAELAQWIRTRAKR